MARIVFAGSPALAVPYLRALATHHDIVLVITREDSPVGRKRIIEQTPVGQVAEELEIPVIKTSHLNSVVIPDCDLAVVVAYGALVPDKLLATPVHGWINVHFSLLPALRGAAPIQRGLWNGDSQTGVTIFQLVHELDAGPIFSQRPIPFLNDESASEALLRISQSTTDDLVRTVNGILDGSLTSTPQKGTPTSAHKFTREEAHIDWTRSATEIHNRVRALTNEPGAFAILHEQRINVLSTRVSYSLAETPGSISVVKDRVLVGTGNGTIELLRVKPAGKSEMAARDWARGLRSETVFE